MNPKWPVPPNHPSLDANTAHVWAVTIDADPTNIDRCLSLLSADELRRAKSFQVDSARRQFIITRAVLRSLLGRYLELSPGQVSIETNENKKPHLAEQDMSHGLQFNVAHSGDLALVAVTRGTPIGIDIERHRIMRLAEPIAQRYFHPWEAQAIESASATERDAMFLRCWTAKEAILKAIGIGLTDRLSQFFVPFDKTDVDTWFSIPGLMSRGELCFVRYLDAGKDYHAAVAIAGARREICCMTFNP
jgi:4'-phosphopantetheinyl transferase